MFLLLADFMYNHVYSVMLFCSLFLDCFFQGDGGGVIIFFKKFSQRRKSQSNRVRAFFIGSQDDKIKMWVCVALSVKPANLPDSCPAGQKLVILQVSLTLLMWRVILCSVTVLELYTTTVVTSTTFLGHSIVKLLQELKLQVLILSGTSLVYTWTRSNIYS